METGSAKKKRQLQSIVESIQEKRSQKVPKAQKKYLLAPLGFPLDLKSPKGGQEVPKGLPKRPKGAQRGPKGFQSDSQSGPRAPKGDPREPKRYPEGCQKS